jgi:hypothetical protein
MFSIKFEYELIAQHNSISIKQIITVMDIFQLAMVRIIYSRVEGVSQVIAFGINDLWTRFCIVGGQPPGIFSNNERYDTTNNKWTVEAPMPTAIHGLAAASVGDKIFVIGGGPQPGDSAVNSNELFHVNSGR